LKNLIWFYSPVGCALFILNSENPLFCALGELGEKSSLNGRVSNFQVWVLTKLTKDTKLTKGTVAARFTRVAL
jgi:hypothetical protein